MRQRAAKSRATPASHPYGGKEAVNQIALEQRKLNSHGNITVVNGLVFIKRGSRGQVGTCFSRSKIFCHAHRVKLATGTQA